MSVRRLALALVILLCACSSPSAHGSTGAVAVTTTSTTVARCTGKSPIKSGVYDKTFAGRHYQLTIPKNYTATKPLPVVFGLHALTVSYLFVAGMTGFSDMAPKYAFIGVSPSGLVDKNGTPYWLAANAPGNYDITFISRLLDKLEADLCVDPTRVFSTGMSNGAQMSSLLACRLPDRFTAVAPVAGVEFTDACKGRPVPVIAFHGTADPIVLYNGGGLNATRIADSEYYHGHVPPGIPVHHGVDAAMQAWAAHNHCDPVPVEQRIAPHVRRRTWQHCAADTVLYIVDGAGHAWPGKPVPAFEKTFGPGTKEIDASTLIFSFFFSQPPRG